MTGRGARRTPRTPAGWLELRGIHRNNLHGLDARFPAGRVHRGHRRVRFGQVQPGQPGAGGAGRRASGPRAGGAKSADSELPVPSSIERTRGRLHAGAKAIKRLVQRRPEADRPHAAFQPGHLYRPVRPRAPAVRRHAHGQGTPLQRRPFLVQRGAGPLRHLRRRRLRARRTAVHAQRVRAMPDLPRPALQRQDAGSGMERAQHRPGAGA